MNPIKRIIHAAASGAFRLIAWSNPDGAEDEYTLSEIGEQIERDAAYLTTGLITASRAVNTAHEEGKNCTPYHDATADLLTSVNNPLIAIRIIQHLLDIVSQMVDDEDVQRMVASIVATELGHDEESDDEENDEHNH